ncbi:carboxypeptidase regulatory-like domain-containing protein [uncultured Paludibaculum sp.]|uniref:TonB-dependent receptor n=1 Tax=uncultured Paludibaculum sp. TaxID=1765020 RepID=UPI002AAA7D78|nr:carboxypeptidase regulatory-like domain-containing protein [uncultured Paludibaculum sp.]
MRESNRRRLLAVLLLAGAGLGTATAQTAGNLVGQVLDSSGAVIAGATVTATNTANGNKRQVNTGNEGRFTIANIAIGAYDVSASQTNFQTSERPNVKVNVGETVRLEFTLSPGATTQVIQVTDETPLSDASNGAGATFSNSDVVGLPINGRDYARFSLLSPGAVARSNYISDISFNGQHTVHNQFAIDGVDATRVDQPYMANGFERGARLLTGSLDTIAEFRVQTSNYRAEYGRAAGSFVNIATKSGSNAFHGDFYEFFRNDFLDARNFFNKQPSPQAKYRFNDFGGNISGPIRANKSFFFANYEGSRQRIGITGSGTTPSAFLRQSVVSTSPALAPLIAEYPLGTSSTSNQYVDNYTTTAVSQVREDTASVRLDHRFNDSNFAYVRVNVNDSHVFGPLFGVTTSALGLQDFQNVPIRTSNVAVHDEHIITPTFLNEFLAGMQRWGSQLISDNPYPLLSVTGLTIVPGTRGRTRTNSSSYQVSDTMSLTTGAHSIKWGAAVYRIQVDRKSIPTSSITFTSIQDFINNSAASASVSVGDPGHATWAYQANAFLQDTWQLRKGLTLDYGIRYDYETPPYDPGEKTQSFDTRSNTLGAPGSSYFESNRFDFAPRVALAWQPAKGFVIRSGYGIFYQSYPVGFGAYSVPVNNIVGNTSFVRQQIPALSYPLTPFLQQGTAPLPTVAGFAWGKPDIYAQQWNLTMERQFGQSTAVQVAYIGNHGLNLRRNMNLNFYDPTLGRRPISGFADVNVETASGQNAYHSLQVSVTQRYRRGVQGSFNYTWAHAIDDVQDQGLYSGQPQNNNDYRSERGNSSGDMRHNVTYNLHYELPVGQGQHFLSNLHGAGSVLVSGWQVASLAIFHSGIANTVYLGTNTYGNFNFTNQRPNAVAGVSPYAADKSIDNWLNPAAFSMPASGTFGNLARNTIYGPGFAQVDFSVLKQTPMGEGKRMEFRAEIFNILNHPNFGQPNTTFGTASFGKVFNTFGATLGFGTSRQIQLAMKFIF